MTPKRAFWEAVATVCVPSLLIWSIVAYLLRVKVDAEAWPIYLVLVVLPFPLCIPVYRYYLKGTQFRKPRTRRSYVVSAIFFGILSFDYALRLLLHHSEGGIWMLLLAAIGWLGLCIDQAIRAVRTKPA